MILVTGGTGLVGSHLLYNLSLEHDSIRAIYRSEHSIKKTKSVFELYTNNTSLFSKIEWFQADITNIPSMITAFKGVDYVYHCAAFISFKRSDYREMRKVNIHGAAIIANLAIDAKVKKLCYVSSIAAVGDSLPNKLIDESCMWNKELDNSGYSITKFGGEMEIWRASQENVDVVIVNPGVIFGGGFWESGSGKLFNKVYHNLKFYTEGITGFVSVEDVVKSMILLMKSEIKNERFILVSENKSFKEIVFKIADSFEKKRPKIRIKKWQTAIIWRVSWLLWKLTGKSPLLSKYSARSAHTISNYSSLKIKKAINFEFEPIDKVIERVCNAFKL